MKIIKYLIICSVLFLAFHGANCYIEEYQCNKYQVILKERWKGIIRNRRFDFNKDHYKIQDGTTMEIPEIFALACCDCGLSHLHRLYEDKGNHYMSIYRNKNMTKLNREAIDYLCKPKESFQLIAKRKE